MKKIALMALGLVLVAGVVSAETTVSVSPGYVMNSMKFKIDGTNYTFSSNSFAVNLDAKTTIGTTNIVVFGGLQAAFPTKYTFDYDEGSDTIDLSSSHIITGTLGGGYLFQKDSHFPFFIGAGLAMNSLRYDDGGITTEISTIGLVATIQGNYYFTKNLGALAGVDFGYYFACLKAEQKADGEYGDPDTTYDMKDDFKSGTNLNLRIGLTYRF